ncbi:lasso peptide biosynthesis PqqD family chaperone [Streptomyces spongiae]|uniref:Lasso peptide biosynthesis PqqD family chaperone n=1 Tax=Streptomyces spongiae TaxID=565072 RepID=A0A5N8X8P7_9ACTN|nr:lasso peptide biosynthesis PqqD family chaperone [Streptomyces spongiae]MPY55799.1 lasso peptide biosynthesis PqqD family chaperone [Streptomyces spongiae]
MTFTLKPDVTPTDTEHGTVLLDERRGRYFQLNLSGGLILRTLLEGATPERAADVLRERYGITADRATADVHALLTALRDARLATA